MKDKHNATDASSFSGQWKSEGNNSSGAKPSKTGELTLSESSSLRQVRCTVKKSIDHGLLVELSDSLRTPAILLSDQEHKAGTKLDAIVIFQDNDRTVLLEEDAKLGLEYTSLQGPDNVKFLLCVALTVPALTFLFKPGLVLSLVLIFPALIVSIWCWRQLEMSSTTISIKKYMEGAPKPEIRNILVEKLGKGDRAQLWAFLSGRDRDVHNYAQLVSCDSKKPPTVLLSYFTDRPSSVSRELSLDLSSDVQVQSNGKVLLKDVVLIRSAQVKRDILLVWRNHVFLAMKHD